MNRKIIKILVSAEALCLAAGVSPASIHTSAESGDVVGQIYSTDILAVINGKQAPSYNTGSKTVVIIEDLAENGYGIGYEYSDEERTLYCGASHYTGYPVEEVTIERGTVGEIIGDIYSTDIKVIFNGHEVTAYNLGGKTAVCIEDLGALDGSSSNEKYGYSKYLCNFEWDGENRTISLNAVGGYGIQDIGVPSIKYTFTDNVMTAEYSPFYDWSSYLYSSDKGDTFEYSGSFPKDKYVLRPVYLKTINGEYEIGISYLDRDGRTEMFITDPQYTAQLVSEIVEPPVPYEDAIKLLNDGVKYKTLDKADMKDYTFLVVQELQEKHNEYSDIICFIVSKTGGFVNVCYSSTGYTARRLIITGDNSVVMGEWPFAGSPLSGTVWMNQEFNCADYGI